METKRKNIKVAFVVGTFPVVSETFIINQIADLLDRGLEVEIFSFQKDDRENVSDRFYTYDMIHKVHYLDMPRNYIKRFFLAIKKVFHVFCVNPMLFFKTFNLKKYRRTALSLQLLFWVEPFLKKEFDLVHCHFGPVANNFLLIKEVLGLRQKMVTTFYGYDVSILFQEKSADYYDKLKKECSLFFVMSKNMKERIVKQGFEENKIRVLPVGIDVDSYPFKERQFYDGEMVKIISVGRFVEKKGFDDLLRALAIVKRKTIRPIKCCIVGDGSLREELFSLTEDLNLQDVVEYKGYMKIEDIMNYFLDMHVFVQPSKTAQNGDME
jgi:colanic acid/amylovoran biosynthesis glycosyltransferase